MTRRCNKCNITKPVTDFYTRSNGRQVSSCKECEKLDSKVRKREKREWLYTFKESAGCVDCGESDFRVLDFDHVKGSKLFTIGQRACSSDWDKLKKEIAKCVVRCANCHRKRTWDRRRKK